MLPDADVVFEARSQPVAVDVVLVRRLLHAVTDHRAEGTQSVTLLVLLQLVLGYVGEALAAVATYQRLPGGGAGMEKARWVQ